MIKYFLFSIAFITCIPSALFCQTLRDSLAAIVVLNPGDALPSEAIAVGKEIRIIDRGFALNCSYRDVLTEGKKKALGAGGNMLKITQWRAPGGTSPCFGIIAQAYRIKEVAALQERLAESAKAVMRSFLPDSAGYAVLHVYQPGGLGAFNSYNIRIGDSIVCKVKDSHYYRIRVHKEGETSIRAGKGREGELSLDIHFGQAYFVKCGLSAGAFSSHPTLVLQDATTAVEELQLYTLIKDAN